MPRLSMFKPEKGKDYKFFDRTVLEMFTVGGTDIHLHKYLGPYDQGAENKDGDASPTQPNYDGNTNEQTIQDLLFLENRDRKYDSDIYTVRGIYNVQDMDFNLSQFGMFLSNDTVFLTVHMNDTVERIGRKPVSGDVIELPHMKDEYSLDNDITVALKRFYVIEDVNRAAEGFSPTWWPHLLRLKLKSLVDSQEYQDILGDASDENSLASYMSSYNRELQINNAVVQQGEADAPTAGFDYKHFYVAPTDEQGNIRLNENNEVDSPERSPYGLYYAGCDEDPNNVIPPNGHPAGFGITFPDNPDAGDYWIRTDFLPNRLFRYNGKGWLKVEDGIRQSITNNDTRTNYKTKFINGLTDEQRKSLTDALKPEADN